MAVQPYVRFEEGAALPTPSVSYIGVYFNVLGGTGNKDQVYFCNKGDDDNYDWVEIANGGEL